MTAWLGIMDCNQSKTRCGVQVSIFISPESDMAREVGTYIYSI